jgi:hypothetical protein
MIMAQRMTECEVHDRYFCSNPDHADNRAHPEKSFANVLNSGTENSTGRAIAVHMYAPKAGLCRGRVAGNGLGGALGIDAPITTRVVFGSRDCGRASRLDSGGRASRLDSGGHGLVTRLVAASQEQLIRTRVTRHTRF